MNCYETNASRCVRPEAVCSRWTSAQAVDELHSLDVVEIQPSDDGKWTLSLSQGHLCNFHKQTTYRNKTDRNAQHASKLHQETKQPLKMHQNTRKQERKQGEQQCIRRATCGQAVSEMNGAACDYPQLRPFSHDTRPPREQDLERDSTS